MSEETFAELMQSVAEGAKIFRGELPPASEFVHLETPVKVIRQQLGLSQQEFANLFGVSQRTLANWERGPKDLIGPARALLTIFEKLPQQALNALQTPRY
jgi:putative transcriptional regulator